MSTTVGTPSRTRTDTILLLRETPHTNWAIGAIIVEHARAFFVRRWWPVLPTCVIHKSNLFNYNSCCSPHNRKSGGLFLHSRTVARFKSNTSALCFNTCNNVFKQDRSKVSLFYTNAMVTSINNVGYLTTKTGQHNSVGM